MANEANAAQLTTVPLPPWFDNIMFDGVPFRRSIFNYNRLANVLPNLQIRKSDVLLATHPRSGTHWIKCILACLYQVPGNYDAVNESTVSEKVEWWDGNEEDVFNGTCTEEQQLLRWINATEPRLFHSHSQFKIQPPGVQHGDCKTILVVRNPKDVAVSLYYMMSSMQVVFTFNGSFDEFFSAFMAGQVAFGGGDYFSYYKSWWERRHDIPMLIVHYEDMKRDLATEIQRMAEFLNRPGHDINRIADFASFNTMKTAPCVAGIEDVMKGTKFFRKGIVGDWKNVLTVAQSEAIDKRMKEELDGIGFVVKYE